MGELADFVSSQFANLADPETGRQMAAYMKTDDPFWGIKKPRQVPVLKAMVKQYQVTSQRAYRSNVLDLWALPHREEKYAAIQYAKAFKEFQVPQSMPLFRKLIREGAWWDSVDDIAINLTGMVWLRFRPETETLMDEWIEDKNLWIRRSAIIGQLKHKESTDTKRLYAYCRAQAADTDFFIRKAIGWALRQQARIDPDGVRGFLAEMGDSLSGLSRREAAKHL